MARYYLTNLELSELRKYHFNSDEEFAAYLTEQGIEPYESREALDLRMNLQERINTQPWNANHKNTGLMWERIDRT
jgi:hypothetical protein